MKTPFLCLGRSALTRPFRTPAVSKKNIPAPHTPTNRLIINKNGNRPHLGSGNRGNTKPHNSCTC